MSRSLKMNRLGRITGAVLAMTFLAGCSQDFYDSRTQGFIPEYPEQTYPIQVKTGRVNLRLPVVTGQLTGAEREAVQRLARQASSLTTPVYVIRPAGSVKAEVLAAQATRVLLDYGVSQRRIVHRANGAPGEVRISYQRKFAVTRECGDWSKPLNETGDNRTYRNFGCAQQFNIAAQVDNPQDFVRPRVMSLPDADARNRAIEKYRKGEDHTSEWPGGSRIRIDEGLKATVQK